MSKNMYDTKALGIAEDFKGVDTELEKVHKEMGEEFNIDNDYKEHEQFYLTKAEQLAVRVFEHQFYTKDIEQYEKYTKERKIISENIKTYLNSFTHKYPDFDYNWENNKIIEKIEEEFDKYDGYLEFLSEYKTEHTNTINIEKIKKLILSSMKTSLYEINDEGLTDLAKEVIKYFTPYEYISNQSGYLAGIYKNNGQLADDKNPLYDRDKNLITMTFVKEKDFAKSYKVLKSFIGFGTGSLFSYAFTSQLASSSIADEVLLSKNLININNFTNEFKDYLSNTFSVVTYNVAMNELENSPIGKKLRESIESAKLLCSQITDNQGIHSQLTYDLNILSNILGLAIPITPINLIVSFILGPFVETVNSIIDEKEGHLEVQRFIENVKKGNEIDTQVLKQSDEPITYKNETELSTIIADGSVNNITGGRQNNYIRAINGDNNVLSGEGGDDYIIGFKKNDTLKGGYGDDNLVGLEGDDILCGGAGNNTYFYRKGDGNDYIQYFSDNSRMRSDLGEINKLLIKGYLSKDIREVIKYKQNAIKIIFNNNDSIVIEYDKVIEQDQAYKKRNIYNENIDYINFLDENDPKYKYIKFSDLFIAKYNGYLTTNDLDNFVVLINDFGQKVNITKGNNKISGGQGSDRYIFTKDTKGTTTIKDNHIRDDLNNMIVLDKINMLNFTPGSNAKGIYTRNQEVKFSYNKNKDLVISYGQWNAVIDKDSIDKMSIRFNDGIISASNYEKDIQDAIEWKMKYNKHNLEFDSSMIDRSSKSNVIVGTDKNDYLYGKNDGSNEIYGYEGNDYIYGGAYDNLIYGGSGNDYIAGGSGVNIIYGGEGNDHIKAQIVKPSGLFQKDIYYSNNYIDGEGGDDTIFGGEQEDYIFGNIGDDYLYGAGGADKIEGGYGNDKLYGGSDKDILLGNQGTDYLSGGEDDDYLDGGDGDDILQGDGGNDTYVLKIGGGSDTIYNSDNEKAEDTILIGEGIKEEDIYFVKIDSNLEIRIKNQKDKLIIKDYYSGSSINKNNDIERIQFSNGKVLNKYEIQSKVVYLYGDEKNNNIYGSHDDNIIYGYDGRDNIYGNDGDDIIEGNKGDDYLEGREDSDTYIFKKGDGIDRIEDNPYSDKDRTSVDTLYFKDVLKDEIEIIRTSSDEAELRIKGTDDKVILKYLYNYAQGIEQIKFADGKVYTLEDLRQEFHTLRGDNGNNQINAFTEENYIMYGNDGRDTISGRSGRDVLDGGAGNDYLSGSLGSDTYVFSRGDGQDKIYDYNYNKDNKDIDKIVFKDINKDDVLITKENESDITLKIKESEDKITIQSAHSKSYYGIEEIHFADGEILTYEDIMSEKFKYETDDKNNNITTYSTDDEIYGLGGDDKINAADGNNYVDGGEGDDMITSGSGQDILIGGKGNDYLEGRLGSDTYIFSRGDGQDKIYDYDTNIQNKDMVQIGYDFLNTIFKRDGSNLTIGFTDSNDSITINNWYNGSSYQIEEIQSSDNHTITNIQLQLMIDAMASYTSQKGIDWNTAIKENPNEIQSILQNFWVTKIN